MRYTDARPSFCFREFGRTHDKLDTTARCTRVATGMIASIESPLDLLSEPRRKPSKSEKDQPSA